MRSRRRGPESPRSSTWRAWSRPRCATPRRTSRRTTSSSADGRWKKPVGRRSTPARSSASPGRSRRPAPPWYPPWCCTRCWRGSTTPRCCYAGMEDVPASAASVRDVAGLLKRTRWRAAELQAFRRARPRQDQFVREFKRAGGLIAAGSDAANQLLVPGLSLHEEIALLVAAGFTAVEAITAATRKGAQLLHADSLGLLGAGKVADLVVLDGDPVTTIAATRRIAWVMIRGRIIQPDSLRKTWAK